jgi:hypothetical protein
LGARESVAWLSKQGRAGVFVRTERGHLLGVEVGIQVDCETGHLAQNEWQNQARGASGPPRREGRRRGARGARGKRGAGRNGPEGASVRTGAIPCCDGGLVALPRRLHVLPCAAHLSTQALGVGAQGLTCAGVWVGACMGVLGGSLQRPRGDRKRSSRCHGGAATPGPFVIPRASPCVVSSHTCGRQPTAATSSPTRVAPSLCFEKQA